MKRLKLVINGKTIRDQPPVVGDYCWPGSTGNLNKPCFHAAATCANTYSKCQRCGFSYCTNHLTAHIRPLPALPPDTMKALLKRLRTGLTYIAQNPKRHFPTIEVVTRAADRPDR